MSVPIDVVLRISELFHLPRRFAPWDAVWVKGYNRKEQKLLTPELLHKLIQDTPITVGIQNWNEQSRCFTDSQDFCVFDSDDKNDIESAKKTALKIAEVLENNQITRLITASRGKGYHVWVFFEEPIPSSVVSEFQAAIMAKCGFERHNTEDYVSGTTHIETLIASGEGKVVKIPFSLHPKYPDRREIPLSKMEMLTFDPTKPDTEEIINNSYHWLDIVLQTNRDKIIKVIGKGDITLPATRMVRKRPTTRTRYSSLKIPDNTPRMQEMLDLLHSVPCLDKCYTDATTKDSIYWQRGVLVAALSRAGFSKEDIGCLFKNHICDDEDLANVGELEKQVNFWAGRKTHAQCKVLQDEGSEKFCCPGPCGRASPVQEEKRTIIPKERIENPIWDTFGKLYKDGKNYQVFKTTRAKVTTQSIIRAVADGKKILQVVPTQKITKETFAKTVRIAKEKYGVSIKGAVLTDIRTSCLKNKLEVEHFRRFHDTKKSAYEKLQFVQKHPCSKCKYKKEKYRFTPNDDEPIIESCTIDDEKKCAHISIVNNLDQFNVIVITYKKLLALINSVQSEGTCRWMIEGGHAGKILDTIRNMDIIMLDEVSHFTDTPYHEVPLKVIRRKTAEGFNFFDELQKQIQYIFDWEMAKIKAGEQTQCFADQITLDSGKALEELKKLTKEMKGNVTVYKRNITEDERAKLIEVFYAEHTRIIEIAKKDDEALNFVIDMLVLLPEVEWIITSTPDATKKVNISVLIAPKVKDTLDFFRSVTTQIIATDGTMPLVDLSALMGIPFEKINIGDPEKTSELCRVVADVENIRAPEMMNNKKRLQKWLQWANTLFGDKLIIATTNIEIYERVKKEIDDLGIKVEIMYHRSGESIGVECDKRVMLNLCAPYTPRNTQHWLKVIYDKQLEGYTVEDIWEYEKIKTDFQTMSRVKDPHAKEKSVVICYGQDGSTLNTSLGKCVSPPKLLWPNGEQIDDCPIPLRIAERWLNGGFKCGEGG